jgi:phage tail sheath gpL-like
MASNAVGIERVSRIVGYIIKKGDFRVQSSNLPQRIAVLAEANEANQTGLSTTARQITSAQQAGALYGYGSPIHQILRILKPLYGDGVGGIPIIVYPQAKASGAAAKVIDITPSGTATANGTHYLVINGRDNLEGVFYAINILAGDTPAVISGKIEDAINVVLGCPVSAISTSIKATATAKWAGLTSQDISISVDTNDNDLGVSYVVAQVTAGSGTPSIAGALSQFGNEWNTVVVNSYGTVTSVLDALEAFNGIPHPENPTGRYQGVLMKPFIAITGSIADDPSSVTDGRSAEVTVAIAPAPLSKGLPLEAAANMTVLYAVKAQNNPEQDVNGLAYPDMPTPSSIGSMASYDTRDVIVKKGCSTVDLVAGAYVVQDFVTTYHPLGEEPPQFRYVRNLNLDFNVRYTYYLNEQLYVVDHVIARDEDIVNVPKFVRPKDWKSELNRVSDELVSRGLTVDSQFTKDSIEVDLSTSNPDRLETFFRYKRSGIARISSTTAEAGFNFGNLG